MIINVLRIFIIARMFPHIHNEIFYSSLYTTVIAHARMHTYNMQAHTCTYLLGFGQVIQVCLKMSWINVNVSRNTVFSFMRHDKIQ